MSNQKLSGQIYGYQSFLSAEARRNTKTTLVVVAKLIGNHFSEPV
jgi:hypothetical protein